MSTFGEKLEFLRQSQNLTSGQVAEKVGIPQSRLRELEKGIRIPTDGQIDRLEQFYQVESGQLAALMQ